MTEIRSRLALALSMLMTTFAVGTAGYAAIEGWPQLGEAGFTAATGY